MPVPQKRERGGANKNLTLEVRLDKKKNMEPTGAQRPAKETQGKTKMRCLDLCFHIRKDSLLRVLYRNASKYIVDVSVLKLFHLDLSSTAV